MGRGHWQGIVGPIQELGAAPLREQEPQSYSCKDSNSANNSLSSKKEDEKFQKEVPELKEGAREVPERSSTDLSEQVISASWDPEQRTQVSCARTSCFQKL